MKLRNLIAGLMALAAFRPTLPAAAPQERQIQLLDETVVVPRGGARSIRVSLKQQPAAIVFRYTNVRGGEGVRAILLTENEAEKFSRGGQFETVATTPYGNSGQITKTVPSPGDYELVFDNTLETKTRAVVRWQAALVFGHSEIPQVSYLPSRQRVLVFAASGLFLFAMAVFTAGRVRTALAERRIRESHWPRDGYPPPNEPLT
jgi:hypothetical protein